MFSVSVRSWEWNANWECRNVAGDCLISLLAKRTESEWAELETYVLLDIYDKLSAISVDSLIVLEFLWKCIGLSPCVCRTQTENGLSCVE